MPHLPAIPLEFYKLEAAGTTQSDLSPDDALFAQAKLKSYREPDDQVIDHFKEWVAENGKTNGAPLEYGLNIPRQDCLDVKRYGDLASIAGLEKTWTHRFIDRHGCLRTQFQKVRSFPAPASCQALPII
jgi:hypothetical protein